MSTTHTNLSTIPTDKKEYFTHTISILSMQSEGLCETFKISDDGGDPETLGRVIQRVPVID